jgi:YesN/AraC family two-component response regulator
MIIQISLIVISILLIIILGLLLWVIRINLKKINPVSSQKTISTISKRLVTHIKKSKYANSKLNENVKEEYLKKVVYAMEVEKMYRKPDLTIGKLAKELSIPKHHLSQIINEKMNVSFLDFVNRHRIQEAKEKLIAKKYRHLSIVEIGRLVGFNAKSTFYTVFKKYAASTPGVYRQKSWNNYNKV